MHFLHVRRIRSGRTRTPVQVRRLSTCLAMTMGWLLAAPALAADDPVFDHEAIAQAPLHVEVIETTQSDDGVVTFERLRFLSQHRGDEPVWVEGILGRPTEAGEADGRRPAVFWSQGGMAGAGRWAPELFARRGYVCLNITLQHATWNAFGVFNAANPGEGNITRLAIDQMRGVTLLANRDDVDPDRIGFFGASYGGFFASLVSAADPRIKCGASFFAGGHHELGTNLPQFNGLAADQAEAWRPVDPAWRHAQRDVPFLWAAAANDNWFFLPAVALTAREARSPGSRLAIIPHWQHGFPPNVDEQIFSWADVWLQGDRPAYVKPGELRIERIEDRLIASWNWTGEPNVTRAELVVAYGRVRAWHDWVWRHHEVFEARIDPEQRTAVAELVMPGPGVEALVYGNLIDEQDVVITAGPAHIRPGDGLEPGSARVPVAAVDPAADGLRLNPDLRVNAFPWGAFGPMDVDHFQRMGLPHGVVDSEVALLAGQSLRFDPGKSAAFDLRHIPEHEHRLSVRLRANQPTELIVRVTEKVFAAARRPLAEKLRADALNPDDKPAVTSGLAVEQLVRIGEDQVGAWVQAEVLVPLVTGAPDGYQFDIRRVNPDDGSTFWLDDVRFEPVWKIDEQDAPR